MVFLTADVVGALSPDVVRLIRSATSRNSRIQNQVDKRLLSEDEIDRQSLHELEESLKRINERIDDPEQLGIAALNDVDLNDAKKRAQRDADIESIVLPALLQRKSQILLRMSVLRPQVKLNDLKAAVRDEVEDPETKESLLKSIELMIAQSKDDASLLEKQAEQATERRERLMATRVEIEERRIGLTERRYKIWKSILERESIASIIGGLLLLGLGIALIVAMFIGTSTSEVIVNAFLLILGYFFGQSTARKVK